MRAAAEGEAAGADLCTPRRRPLHAPEPRSAPRPCLGGPSAWPPRPCLLLPPDPPRRELSAVLIAAQRSHAGACSDGGAGGLARASPPTRAPAVPGGHRLRFLHHTRLQLPGGPAPTPVRASSADPAGHAEAPRPRGLTPPPSPRGRVSVPGTKHLHATYRIRTHTESQARAPAPGASLCPREPNGPKQTKETRRRHEPLRHRGDDVRAARLSGRWNRNPSPAPRGRNQLVSHATA